MAGRLEYPTAWQPQRGPQTAFVESEVFEVVYGGARGGGKTDGVLGDFAIHAARFGSAAKGLLVRRSRVALEPAIRRAREIFGPEGAQWIESKSAFRWRSGAVLSCRYLDSDSDADSYQGHDYTRVYVEEMTQFADPRPIEKLKATLRSAAGVPVGFRATCNPGGAGHGWVKRRHIDPGPFEVKRETFVSPFDGRRRELERVFIPARLRDNPALTALDPSYESRIHLSGSRELVRAWLEGDWGAVQGAFFDQWSERNVVRPFAIPPRWPRFRSLDWGYATPFSIGWWTIVMESISLPDGRRLPKEAMVRYREWYGGTGGGNEGVQKTVEEVAAGILERERGEHVPFGVADPSIGQRTRGASILETFAAHNVFFELGDNTRVSGAGAMTGWAAVRSRIAGGNEGPMLYVFDSCHDFLRTVPAMQHDPRRLEDMDSRGEDHIADETRYACMFNPYLPPPPEAFQPPPGPRDPRDPRFPSFSPRLDGWDWDGMREEERTRGIGWHAW